MVSATDLKNGTTFLMDGKPFRVVKYTHQKIGRGGASVKLQLRNLARGSLEEKAVNSTAKFDEINTIKKPMQFLFSDGDTATFMDAKTYEQTEIPFAAVKDQVSFIKEGGMVDILFWHPSTSSGQARALSVGIPPKVTLEVVDTTPGVKGNSTSNMYKPAKLENGLSVKVPLFIKANDKVRVDTRTGEYVERVSS